MQKQLFGTNGIRGVVNEELTSDFAIKVAEAIGTFFNQGRVLIGFDGRTSSNMLANAVTSGLMSTGCNVFDMGLTPTPCLQYAVKNHNMTGGIMITASHNPVEYNGIKVMGADGIEIPRSQEIEIESMFFENKKKYVNWRNIGHRKTLTTALNEYKEAVKRHVDVEAIRQRHYHVVVDAANGVGALVTPYLLGELGCRVTTINAHIDGTSPNRAPEPRPENLQDLVAAVVAVKADFGVAFDGDADRSIFVDELGRIQWGDRTFALIAKDFLQSKGEETIVTPVSSSRVIREITEKYGGKLVWTKVGSTVVSHTMKRLKAKLGGEENGGVFYGPHQRVRDGAMTTALILNIMSKTGEALSKLLSELPRYYLKKEKMECPSAKKMMALERMVANVRHLEPETVDGVKLWLPDQRSILIRPSGTEPIYRFYAEAESKEKASELVEEYKRMLRQILNSVEIDITEGVTDERSQT